MKFSPLKIALTALGVTTATFSIAAPSQAFDLYFGEDLNFNGTGNTRDRLLETPNATAAETAFLSRFDNVGTATFDDFALNTSSDLDLLFEGAATATLSGAGKVSNMTEYGVHPLSGDKYWLTNAGNNDSFRVDFDNAVAGFGFFATDIGDVGATVQIELGLANGGTQVIDFNHQTTSGQSGSVLYQGILAENEDELFTSVRFSTTNGQGDGFGFDNLTVGSFSQVSDDTVSTPEPGLMLGFALLGLVGAGSKLKKK